MKRITIVWTIMLIVIFAGLTVIGLHIKKETINDLMEEEIVKQTEKYLGLYVGLYPKSNESLTLTVDELINKGYDPKLESDCDGYIVIKNTDMGFKYYPYIKCLNYTTEGYENNK